VQKIQNFGYDFELFHSLKHSRRSSIIFATILSQYYDKRAQRALGRSPEEKVKGHSGSNNREPQGHNLNNFDRGPFDDVIY